MGTCGNCGREHEKRTGLYCCFCHAAYTREWRKTHPMSAEAKKRDAARSYAAVYKKRGKLKQKPCEYCGDKNSQMHHIDHELPLDVTWLCRPCHLAWHAHWRMCIRETFLMWLIKDKTQKPERAA